MVETGFTLCDYGCTAGNAQVASSCETASHDSQYETPMFSYHCKGTKKTRHSQYFEIKREEE